MSAAADTVSAKPFVSFLPDPVTERSQQLERLETELTELWGHITAADYRFLKLLAEFDEIKGYEAHGLTGTAQWLSWQCGIGGNAARERVRVARALERLPKISDAFRRGVISYSKVRAITRVATPADEHILLNTALHGSAPHVERHVRGFRFCQRRDEAREANDRHRERYLKVYRDENGAVVIHAVLPAEVGALVEKALEAAVAELDEPAAVEVNETESNVSTATRVSGVTRAGDADSTPSLRVNETESNVSTETSAAHKPDGSAVAEAVAATETAATSTAGDEDLTSRIDAMLDEIERRDRYRVRVAPEVSEARHEPLTRHGPFATKRADALRLLAESFLTRRSDQCGSIADRYQVCVHIDQRLLSRQVSEALSPDADVPDVDSSIASPRAPNATGGPAATAEATGGDAPSSRPLPPLRHDLLQHCELEGSERVLAIETARRLACDCSLVGIVDGAQGSPLDVGRRTRSIPPALQRALRARDGGCRFPGCDRTKFTEGHHVIHWANGGETKLDNLVTLCTFHHRLVHEGGFEVHASTDPDEREPFVFLRPDGTRVEPNGRRRLGARPVARADGSVLEPSADATLEELLRERNRQAGLEIDAHTSRCGWRGERFDVSAAIEAQQWHRERARRDESGSARET